MRALLALTVALTASAASAEPTLPPHILRHVQRMVNSCELLAVVRVDGAPQDGNVRLLVQQTLLGEMPETVTVSTLGFAPEDLQDGTSLLVPFEWNRGVIRALPRRYELVVDGKIREYATETFLSAVEQAIARRADRVSSWRIRKPHRAWRLVMK